MGDDDEKKKKEDKEQCNYWKLLQDDIYRWAVTQQHELWQVNAACDVYTVPALQSPNIESNIINYYHDKANKKIVQHKLTNENDENALKSMSEFVCEDEYYKRIGSVQCGDMLKVYAKAGSYLEIREPMHGWVKFKNVGSKDYCVKRKNVNADTQINDEIKEKKEDLKVVSKGNGDFTIFVTKNYLQDFGIYDVVKPVMESEEQKNESMDDAEYNVIDLLNGMNGKYDDGNKVSVLYFYGDIDFGFTFKEQSKHLGKLKNLCDKFKGNANFIMVRVCCIENNTKVTQRLMVGDKEMNGCVYGRAKIDILKKYGLLHYDTGFFKYGLMLLSKDNEIIIHPRENIDDAKMDPFAKVATCIINSK